MPIVATVRNFFAKTVDARFRHDAQGRLVFLPWGFGTGRVVPNAEVEAELRKASLRLMIVLFVVAIPAIAAFNGIYQPTGLAFVAYIAACSAMGFAFQIYPAWLSRNLPRSDERVPYSAAMLQSLDRFSRKFLIFGLGSSLLFVASAALMLVLGTGSDRLTMAICAAIFAPMAAVYAIALKRRGASS